MFWTYSQYVAIIVLFSILYGLHLVFFNLFVFSVSLAVYICMDYDMSQAHGHLWHEFLLKTFFRSAISPKKTCSRILLSTFCINPEGNVL